MKEISSELKKKVDKAQALIDSGKLVTEAAAEVGIHSATFYNTRAKLYGSRRPKTFKRKKTVLGRAKENYQAFPMTEGNSGFELKGSPEEIARFIREMAKKME